MSNANRPTAADDIILHMRGISKRFPGVQALAEVDFDVRRGEVHALVGGNGAGKSTLLKILTGVHRPDPPSESVIVFDGERFHPASPADALSQGISTIYQDVNLVPTLSVAENLLLGRAPRRWFGLDWRRIRRQAAEMLAAFGVYIDVSRELGAFPVGIQQIVGVARAVGADARLIVMDEPTSSLDNREAENFFRVVEQLRARRISIIFVTHFLDQVYRISDRVTVLRNGRRIGVFNVDALPRARLVEHILGRDIAQVSGPIHRMAPPDAGQGGGAGEGTCEAPVRPTPVLSARGLHRRPAIAPVDLDAHSGEVLGIAGLLGSGRTELARLLAGADRALGGLIRMGQVPVKIKQPRDAIRLGVLMTPEGRQADGMIPDLSVRENIALALTAKGRTTNLSPRGLNSTARPGGAESGQRRTVFAYARRVGWMRRVMNWVAGAWLGWKKEQKQVAEELVDRLGIAVADLEQPVKNLSGGNQQKVLFARCLACEPRVLILDEPTRGIDIGAKAEIERLVVALTAGGLAAVFISAELDEVARLSQRVLVLRDRRATDLLTGERVTEAAMMKAIAGDEP